MTARKFAAIFAVLLLCTFPLCADEVDRYVSGFMQRHGIPGMSLAVVRQGKLVKVAGYGKSNLELNVDATAESVFEIGSITKQFTAEAILMLVEEGKISLEAPVCRYLPACPAAWEKIKIRHLLTHTSGLSDWEANGYISYRQQYTAEEYIKAVGAHPLDFQPGERWAYTNSAFPLLGMVVERVTGGSYEQFVSERIFRPAGMTATRFKHAGDIVANRSGGYVDEGGQLHSGEPLRPLVIAPNGGIMSTAGDMGRWLSAYFGGRLLKPSTVEQMLTMVKLNNGEPGSSGMAWFRNSFKKHRMVLHNGSTVAGFSSVVYHYPDDDLSVVVLFNIDRWNAVNVLAQHVAGMYVPGASVDSLPERSDPEPELTRTMLRFLTELGEGKDPEMLADNLRGRVSKDRRASIAAEMKQLKSFTFVDKEGLSGEAQKRFGSVIRWIYRYRLTNEKFPVYYTIELTPEKKVARFVPEED